jgi:hypothetical protein
VRTSWKSPSLDDLPFRASLVDAIVQSLPNSVKAGTIAAEMIATASVPQHRHQGTGSRLPYVAMTGAKDWAPARSFAFAETVRWLLVFLSDDRIDRSVGNAGWT